MTPLFLVGNAFAWPASTDWDTVELGGAPITDPCGDVSGNEWWDIVGSGSDAAAWWVEDATDVYFRLRLHDDPTSGGSWRSFGWGVAFETNWELTSFEYMLFVNGKDDTVTLYENTTQEADITSDSAEAALVAYSSTTNATYSAIGATVCSSGSDYYVDWTISRADLAAYTTFSSITETGLVFGTSANAATFQKDIAGWDGSAGTPTLADVVSDSDWDGDGLDAEEEAALGTDPGDFDSDDDGLGDGDEVDVYGTDPLLDDSDGDGLLDGTEVGLTDADLDADTDTSAGSFVADEDPTTTTDPTLADTDGGGLDDGAEDTDGDGMIDADETDPNDPTDDLDALDSDGDGISNDTEDWSAGTDTDGDGTADYLDTDSDDDGLLDSDEGTDDGDSDGVGNWRDDDSDDDGFSDEDETTEGTDPYDPTSFPGGGDTADTGGDTADTGDTGDTSVVDTSDTGGDTSDTADTGGDTSDTADTGGDTSDTADTGSDTADTSDTSVVDTSDTGDTADTADTGGDTSDTADTGGDTADTADTGSDTSDTSDTSVVDTSDSGDTGDTGGDTSDTGGDTSDSDTNGNGDGLGQGGGPSWYGGACGGCSGSPVESGAVGLGLAAAALVARRRSRT